MKKRTTFRGRFFMLIAAMVGSDTGIEQQKIFAKQQHEVITYLPDTLTTSHTRRNIPE